MVALLRAVVSLAQDSPRHKGVKVRLVVDGADRASDKGGPHYRVLGHDSRLAQVMTNLIDNAALPGVLRSLAARFGRVCAGWMDSLADDDLGDEG